MFDGRAAYSHDCVFMIDGRAAYSHDCVLCLMAELLIAMIVCYV